MFYKSLSIEKFRTFNEEVKFDFRAINLLIGPNGSGKSTVLDILKKIEELNSGSIISKEVSAFLSRYDATIKLSFQDSKKRDIKFELSKVEDKVTIIKENEFRQTFKGSSVFYDLKSIVKSYYKSNFDRSKRLFAKYDELAKNDVKNVSIAFLKPFNIEVDMEKGLFNHFKLSDQGFGIIKLARLAANIDANLIEEPEANLHPNFQSKLADAFCAAWEKDTKRQFIIETHSEYMVRRFQYLVASKKLNSSDIKIFYFGKDASTTIKEIEILDNGNLSDEFGQGFFDESMSQSLEKLNTRYEEIE